MQNRNYSDLPNPDEFYLLVKKLRLDNPSLRSSHAHELLAKSYGFNTKSSYLAYWRKNNDTEN